MKLTGLYFVDEYKIEDEQATKAMPISEQMVLNTLGKKAMTFHDLVDASKLDSHEVYSAIDWLMGLGFVRMETMPASPEDTERGEQCNERE